MNSSDRTTTTSISSVDENDWNEGDAPPFGEGYPVFYCQVCMKRFFYHFAVVQHANDKHLGCGIPFPIPKKG